MQMSEPLKPASETASAAIQPPASVPQARPAQRKGDRFWSQGEPMVWVAGGALAAVLLSALTLLSVVLYNGLGVFWPARVEQVQLAGGGHLLGQRLETQSDPLRGAQVRFKTANREFDAARQDFRWVVKSEIEKTEYPANAVVLERLANGDFYGTLAGLKTPGLQLSGTGELTEKLQQALRAITVERAQRLDPLLDRISAVTVNRRTTEMAQMKARYRKQQAESSIPPDTNAVEHLDVELKELDAEAAALQADSERLVADRTALEAVMRQNVALFSDGQGTQRTIPLIDIVRAYTPNAMSLPAKVGHYLARVWELLSTPPREANTEGGVLPAIFGTVALIILMAISSFPLGVLAGVYLGEYARDGVFVRLVRIGVNNLAGIPSIVYGIFGCGFFINYLGWHIDHSLYTYRLSKGPVFGTGGVLWAALTLGLLTVPVVIVATEEAIRVIPRSVRESSFALGSTKFQTLLRVILPLASPGILTGFILAMARAAGEVAPLMLTGVVNSAATLPLDGTFPYLHVERQFMHLGFQIYSVGFQAPNSEAARPMVYVITLLLILIVLALSGTAIYLRNRMRKLLHLRTI